MTKASHVILLLKVLIFIVILLIFAVGFLLLPIIYTAWDISNWHASEWFLFVQTLVFAISAIIAYRAISSSKDVSRERATLDTILADNKDIRLIEAKADIYSFIEDYKKYYANNQIEHSGTRSTLSQICEVDEVELQPYEYQLKHKMMIVLNRHEFYAIGINSKLLDESLFKRMNCSNYLKLWDKLTPAITQLRSKVGKDTLFKEFELLATRWKANPLKSEDIK